MEFFLFHTESLRIEAVVRCTDCVLWGKCWAIEMTVNTCLFCSNYVHYIDVRKDDTFIWVCCVWWDIVSRGKTIRTVSFTGGESFFITIPRSNQACKYSIVIFILVHLWGRRSKSVMAGHFWPYQPLYYIFLRGLFPAVLVMVYTVWPRANKNLPISPFQWHICVCVYVCWYGDFN